MRPTKMTTPVILFFIDGMAPSAEQRLEAAEVGGDVRFRNARFIDAEHALEKCDGVLGVVPDSYAHLPSGKDAIDAYKERLRGVGGDGKSAPKAAANKPQAGKANQTPAWNGGKPQA